MAIRFNINTVTPDLAVAALRDQKRADKAAHIPDSDIKEVAPDFYEIKSQSRKNVTHQVDVRGKGSCTCEDWTNKQVECKHLKRVRLARRNEVRVLEAGTVKPFFEALEKDMERDSKIQRDIEQRRAMAECSEMKEEKPIEQCFRCHKPIATYERAIYHGGMWMHLECPKQINEE